MGRAKSNKKVEPLDGMKHMRRPTTNGRLLFRIKVIKNHFQRDRESLFKLKETELFRVKSKFVRECKRTIMTILSFVGFSLRLFEILIGRNFIVFVSCDRFFLGSCDDEAMNELNWTFVRSSSVAFCWVLICSIPYSVKGLSLSFYLKPLKRFELLIFLPTFSCWQQFFVNFFRLVSGKVHL